MKLIDKDALVAWAESQIDILERNSGCSGIFGETQIAVFDRLYSFLDTLEVKEVDLEKEFDNYTKNILARDIQFEPFTHLYNCAQHFFELGMSTNNKAQKGE